MYLISAYFDKSLTHSLQGCIDMVAKNSGNTFMIDNEVPPHITIAAFETQKPEEVVKNFSDAFKDVKKGHVDIVTVGAFMPYVLYAAPVLNTYLEELSERSYKFISDFEDIKISRFYRPMQWLPHITLGKKLSKEEMLLGFSAMQQYFSPMSGDIVSIGLAKTNPMRNIQICDLG